MPIRETTIIQGKMLGRTTARTRELRFHSATAAHVLSFLTTSFVLGATCQQQRPRSVRLSNHHPYLRAAGTVSWLFRRRRISCCKTLARNMNY